jgi:hypothetical protein
MQLSGVPLPFSRPSSGIVRSHPPTPVPDSEALMMHSVETHTPAFIFPPPSESVRSFPLEQPEQPRERAETPSSSLLDLTESTLTLDARPSKPPPQSNLSILMAQHGSRSPSRERAHEEEEDTHTPVVSQPTPILYRPRQPQQPNTLPPLPCPIASPLTERTPLLQLPSFPEAHYRLHKWVAHVKSATTEVALLLPAVVLGLLLNILDGISCTSHFAFVLSVDCMLH